VFVGQKYEGQGEDRKAVPWPAAEVENFKGIVRGALGMQETDQLTLEQMPFNDQIPAAMTQQLDKQMKLQYWLDLAQKLIYPALALVVLFAFWRMFQRAKAEEIRLGAPVGGGNGRSHLGHGGASGKGMVTVEVLNQLIRENPANMTQAVRGWLGRSKN
jgi:flagellar biosynthesis/type III secretory pathway M-ring protein FliF/YscJ